ncbi:curlin repeat-containing protein [Aequorivita echinoideorum]|uniref:Curlin associated repeat-containing protein n=1 Tax=Aequorivita echinoideorum TaxID=1549647 RepID=A0ABS5S7C4_9FLAO|nr:curlin repeat-containing protein [Aequorivita echinoideorum]MBT0608277.1 hypothetical protein [Aequorivita echinoideorum]
MKSMEVFYHSAKSFPSKMLIFPIKFRIMKNKIFFSIVLFFICLNMVGQTYKNGDANAEFESFENKSAEIKFLAEQNSQNVQRNSISGEANNSVFINQIGTNNQAIVNTQTNSSDINIAQNGVNNEVFLNVSGERIEETIVQNGNSNRYFHVNPFRVNYQATQILQNGNNQNIEWFGGNSISERLKISMQGESKSMIIRSYN